MQLVNMQFATNVAFNTILYVHGFDVLNNFSLRKWISVGHESKHISVLLKICISYILDIFRRNTNTIEHDVVKNE